MTKPGDQEIDYVAVGREAHELTQRHGRRALAYAEKLAAKALSECDDKEHKFWSAVAAALRPREASA